MERVTKELKAESEYYQGDELGQEKSKELLKEIFMPLGLLPLKDIEECGYHRESGFVWLKQKKKNVHKFEKIGRLVSYDTEVTAVVKPHRITKLTGVKAKELLIWLTLVEINVDNPPTGKIVFKTPSGLSRTFPSAAFELEEDASKGVKEVLELEEEASKEVKEV